MNNQHMLLKERFGLDDLQDTRPLPFCTQAKKLTSSLISLDSSTECLLFLTGSHKRQPIIRKSKIILSCWIKYFSNFGTFLVAEKWMNGTFSKMSSSEHTIEFYCFDRNLILNFCHPARKVRLPCSFVPNFRFNQKFHRENIVDLL